MEEEKMALKYPIDKKITLDGKVLLEYTKLAIRKGQLGTAIYFIDEMLKQWPNKEHDKQALKAAGEVE